MTKTFNFYSKNNSSINNNKKFFLGIKPTDYSSILDDIIADDVIKKNSYLFKNEPIILTGSHLKASDDFTKAAKFLANYKKNKSTKLPFIFGKLYTMADGTYITFYDDEIQIGFDTYKYSDFTDLSFLNSLTTSKKNIIINIYTTGKADIDINIL